MCTVVVSWSPDQPVLVLALRDELTSRPFDDPSTWWPDQPDVVGGRDRTAGGSWCVTDVPSGTTALVLNRPERRVAEAGAPSRGVLPLLGVAHGTDWPEHVELTGMASFNLVLVSPQLLTCWSFDGAQLERTDFSPGTHMVTSGGVEDGKAERYLSDLTATPTAAAWRKVVESSPPSDDLASLVVRHERDGLVYATVLGQLIESVPEELGLSYSRQPWVAGSWTTTRWP